MNIGENPGKEIPNQDRAGPMKSLEVKKMYSMGQVASHFTGQAGCGIGGMKEGKME